MQGVLTPSALLKFDGPSSSANKELSIHRWANWIAGFSGEFVRSAIHQCLAGADSNPIVLDPFAGVGTTLLEANRAGISSIGFEINPYAHLVCRVKLAASQFDIETIRAQTRRYLDWMSQDAKQPRSRRTPPQGFRSRIPFFSPGVEALVLRTLDYIDTLPPHISDVFRVALGSVMVNFSNYSYEPSLGSRPAAGKRLILEAPVALTVAQKLQDMADDIRDFQEKTRGVVPPRSEIHRESFFSVDGRIAGRSIDLVVTSPPYMNNYHYVRNTRPQLFWTGLVQSTQDLKSLEEDNFGKFWQTVRGRRPVPLAFAMPDLEQQIAAIQVIKPEKGIYGGSGWANYVIAYMNDLDKFCSLLERFLKPTGTAVIVIGNSIIQGIELPVQKYLAQIGTQHGLDTEAVLELRTRVGSSIVDTGARLAGHEKRGLYDYAVVLRHAA